MPLDKITVAGQCSPQGLGAKYSWLLMALALVTNLGAFLELFTETPRIRWGDDTRPVYEAHVAELIGFGVLKSIPSGEVKFISRYFAVPKKNDTARAILNLRNLSKLQRRPPSTNLPEIPQLWEKLNAIHNGVQKRTTKIVAPTLVTADIRHWFHEIPVSASISQFFCIRLRTAFYRWCVLPMGWGHSPRIAQCISWGMILHDAPQCIRAGHETGMESEHPPAFVTIYDADGRENGLVTVWYDNFIIIGYNPELVDGVWSNLERNRKRIGAIWGEVNRYSAKEIRAVAHGTTLGEKSKKTPGFLGMELSVHVSPRSREQDATSHIMWRPSEDFVRGSKNLSETVLKTAVVTRQQVAKLVGRLVWNTYARGKSLQNEHRAIEMCRVNTPPGMVKRLWQAPTPLSKEQIHELCQRVLSSITLDWTNARCMVSRVILASDSSDDHGGYIELTESAEPRRQHSWRWPAELQKAHIFVKELVAAIRAVESLEESVRNNESIAIDLVVDKYSGGTCDSTRSVYQPTRH